MNPLEQIMLAWQSLLYTLKQLGRGELWVPWLALGALQLLVIGAVWWFAHPALSWLMAPILTAVAGEEALHYPNVFLLMSGLMARADVVIGALLGSVVIGAATVMFASRYSGAEPRPRAAFALALRRGVALIVANLPMNLLLVALTFGLEAWLESRGSSSVVVRVVQLLALVGALLIQAWFLYVSALVVLAGHAPRAAWAALPRAAGRGIWAGLFLGVLALLPLLPAQILSRWSERIVERGIPELVGWTVVVQVGLTLLTSFVLTGSATMVYQIAVAERSE